MSTDINKRLEELNIKIDDPSSPAGSYVPYVISNNLVFISGQLPFINGELTIRGKIGDNVSVEEGIEMAEACGECGNFTLVRNGTCMKCNTCGATSGCS